VNVPREHGQDLVLLTMDGNGMLWNIDDCKLVLLMKRGNDMSWRRISGNRGN